MTAELFPEPDPDGLRVSRELMDRIRSAIAAENGWLSFERYMQTVLYEPGLGYYAAGSEKFGARGDFTTAPELGDWFAEALAAFLVTQFERLRATNLLELGAGTGRLAEQLLRSFARRGCAPVDYAILETSADLEQRQRLRLAPERSAIRWLAALPEPPFHGIVLANEVVDALPVARFIKQGNEALPLGVARAGDGLAIVPGARDSALSAAVAALEAELGRPLPDGYRSEVRMVLQPWLSEILQRIAVGGMLVIDYGLPRRDYYRAERADGTLICHYRHRAHADPLLWPGLQDLSAWVDYSALADLGHSCGFTLSGYTTQAQFLVASIAGDPGLAARTPDPAQASALKTLILPGEMGEHFKLIWLTRGFDAGGLPGKDFRDWL